MAHILGVRQFNQALSNGELEQGETYVVVDAVRRKIIATIAVQPNPEQIEQNIKVIYTR